MTKSTILILVGLALCLTPRTGLADGDPLVGDRPDFTESPRTIAPDRLQLEMGFTLGESDGVDEYSVGELLMRIGVAANTEIRVDIGSWVRYEYDPGKIDGLADPALGVKQRLLNLDGAVPELALLAATTIPIGNTEVSAPRPEPSLVAAAGWVLNERMALGTNLGWARGFDTDLDERYSSVWLSAALAYMLSGSWEAFLESFGFSQEEADGDATGYLSVGAGWLATDDLRFDVRCGRGFNGLDYDWFAGLGLVARF